MLMNKKRTRKDPFFIGNSYKGLLSHIAVHEDEVTEASGHDEEPKNSCFSLNKGSFKA